MSLVQSDGDRIDALIGRVDPLLTRNDAGFVRRVFDKGIDAYRIRIRQYGLSGCRHVLDAGCGFGQWSIALARENAAVTAIDVMPGRLMFLDTLARELNQSNITVRYADVWKTDFPDASFDVIFCYGVVFLTPWRESVAEFARLLEPGGRLYLNANGAGWYRHLWRTEHNATSDYDPRLSASKVLWNTLKYERGLPLEPKDEVIIEPEALREALTCLDFEEIRDGAEGTVVVNAGTDRTAPFFQGDYDGQLGVYEMLARKRGGPSR